MELTEMYSKLAKGFEAERESKGICPAQFQGGRVKDAPFDEEYPKLTNACSYTSGCFSCEYKGKDEAFFGINPRTVKTEILAFPTCSFKGNSQAEAAD